MKLPRKFILYLFYSPTNFSNYTIAWIPNACKWLKVLLSEKCGSTRGFVIQGHVFRAPLQDSRIDKSGANGQHGLCIRYQQKRSWSADDTPRQISSIIDETCIIGQHRLLVCIACAQQIRYERRLHYNYITIAIRYSDYKLFKGNLRIITFEFYSRVFLAVEDTGP